MNEKHQWMPSTLFDMAALCDRSGMDQPRDVLLEAAMLISDFLNGWEQGAAPVATSAVSTKV